MNSEYKSIIDRIFALSEQLGNISIMEVCGTHTASIYKYGISDVLKKLFRSRLPVWYHRRYERSFRFCDTSL